MADHDLKPAHALMASQAIAKGIINEIARTLKERPGVKSLLRDCNVARYRGEIVFYACVDAERERGDAISFWFEIAHKLAEDAWEASASVSHVLSSGSNLLDEIVRPISRTDELLSQSPLIGDWLLSKANAFDFTAALATGPHLREAGPDPGGR